jgi:hypothetical protein
MGKGFMAQRGLTHSRRIALCFGLLSFTALFAECRKAKPEDVPHGANEFLQLNTQIISRVNGTVFYPNNEPAAEIVVEVHRNPANLDTSLAVEAPRLAACITAEDGKFSFPEIKPGKYVLRIGIRNPAGVNEMLVPIIVKKFRWLRKRSALKLKLELGT